MSGQPKSWPECVGKDVTEVEKQIKSEGFDPEIKPEGAPCTRDYRLNRVRIFVDNNNKVVQAPHTG